MLFVTNYEEKKLFVCLYLYTELDISSPIKRVDMERYVRYRAAIAAKNNVRALPTKPVIFQNSVPACSQKIV